jgi:hypothetical protein
MADIDRIKEKHPIMEVAVKLGFLNNVRNSTTAIHCPSPDHPDKNPSCMLMPEVNRFECKACGVKGDVIDLVELANGVDFKGALEWLGEDVIDKRQPNSKEKHDEYELETYFDDHGISKEMQKIFNLHLGEIYSSELKKILSSAVIPNDMGEKHRVFEGSSKFLSKLGSKVCLFKAGGDKGNNSTIITEGELKAIKIHQETGYEAWSGTGGCKTFEEEWIDEFKDKEKIYIVYDNDKFGLDGAEIVARKLRLGRCYIAQIPEEVGKDITDYFMAGKSKKDFENLLKEAICAEELFNRKAELTGEENEKKAESRVEEVVNLAISAGLKVRLDEGGRSLVILPEHPVTAFLAKSREVENWLRGLIYKKKAGTVSDNTLKTVIGTLTGKAVSENQVVKTYLRTAFIDDRLYYNLGDGKRVVVIDVNGWKIWDGVDGESMPYFLVSSLNKQQVIPAKNGDLKEVLKLINVHDRRSKIILLTTLVAWLFPHIPRPVLLLIGPKGSAKSTTLKIIIMLIDPSHAPLIREPKDLRELAILTTHKSVIGLDNLSNISEELSDFVSMLITGGGYVSRELYSDDRLTVFNRRPAFGFTSIVSVVSRPDLLSRSIIVEHAEISEDKRRDEGEMEAEFEKAAPGILGGMFDIASQVIKILPSIKLQKPPRMADYARYAAAALVAMGGSIEEYERVIHGNLEEQNEAALENSVVGQALINLTDLWSVGEERVFTPTELFKTLKNIAYPDNNQRLTPGFPVAATKLKKFIVPLVENLRSVGVDVYYVGRTSKERLSNKTS